MMDLSDSFASPSPSLSVPPFCDVVQPPEPPLTPLWRESLARSCRPLFASEYLGSDPFVLTGLARDAEPCFDWSLFGARLAAIHADISMTVSGGAPLPGKAPKDLHDLRRHFERGEGLILRRADRHCPTFRSLNHFIQQKLGPAEMQLSATPAGSSVDWHVEGEPRFVVQLAGVKDYYFRSSTGAGRLWMARMGAGDALYLPPGSLQKEECLEHSVSISMAVRMFAKAPFGMIDA